MAQIINGELHAIWCTDDVKWKAEEMGVAITDAQCTSVLENAARCHDATIGINWDVLEFWIEDVTKPSAPSSPSTESVSKEEKKPSNESIEVLLEEMNSLDIEDAISKLGAKCDYQGDGVWNVNGCLYDINDVRVFLKYHVAAEPAMA